MKTFVTAKDVLLSWVDLSYQQWEEFYELDWMLIKFWHSGGITHALHIDTIKDFDTNFKLLDNKEDRESELEIDDLVIIWWCNGLMWYIKDIKDWLYHVTTIETIWGLKRNSLIKLGSKIKKK